MLSCSLSAVRKWEASRELVAKLDTRGIATFARVDVEALAARRVARPRRDSLHLETAEREAEAFEAFSKGLDPVATTIRLRMRPSQVSELWLTYQKHRQVLQVTGAALGELADALDVPADELTSERLLELVQHLRGRLREARRATTTTTSPTTSPGNGAA